MKPRVSITPNGITKWPLHRHSCWEIMYYTDGNGYLQIEKEQIVFEPFMAIAVPPGVCHGSVSIDGFHNISVDLTNPPLSLVHNIQIYHDTPEHEALYLAQMLFRHKDDRGELFDRLLQAYTTLIIPEMPYVQSSDAAVKEIAQQLSKRFNDPLLSASAILRESGYAEDYIRACFKRYMKMTPTVFLTTQRIRHAVRFCEIYNGQISVGRLCELCGFLDATYFSSCFRKHMGLSPKQYLQKIKMTIDHGA